MCTLMSFSHNWKIRFAVAEYPLWSLLNSIRLQSTMCTLMSFSHNWKIRFAVAEYPLWSLLNLGSCSLQNSCTAFLISYLGGYTAWFAVFMLALPCWGSKVLSSPILAWGFRGVICTSMLWGLWQSPWHGYKWMHSLGHNQLFLGRQPLYCLSCCYLYVCS